MLALIVSGLLAFCAAVLADSLDHTLRDPERIRRQFGAEVLGSLPMVKGWRGRLRTADEGSASNALVAISTSQAGAAHAYEEAIRTLRDSILLPGLNGDGRDRPRSLLLTSATPGEGKSTTTAHLAAVHSQQKRKTLLIDADLRRPGVYKHFEVCNDTGMSDVILHDKNWRAALQVPEEFPYLTILPAGPVSRRAADGVGVTLERILIDAAHDYDLVIVDAPPLLGFAETLQIAALVDGVVVVTRAGQTNKNAVANVFSSLKRLRANVIGLA
jgi:capsular exopolysaccharide synthesis family protein